MDDKIKNEWIDMIIDEEEDLTTEELYSLINPNNKKEYFDLVDNIVGRHSIKECKPGGRDSLIFTQEYRRKFKTTAIKYFIECEKDRAESNQACIQTYPTYPVYPVQPDTTPWNPGVFYCNNTSTTNIK